MEKGNEKKSAKNHKRSRPEWDRSDNVEAGADEQICLQTPHTLRLLKLIKEGTLEHARIAASHLASLDASPIVLWDLLGRLQAFLCSPQWSTRLHASLAIQGVAQHIPPSDQRDFLEATYSGPLWLNIEEVSQGLDAILSQGRILLAKCDTSEDSFASQEDVLKRLDENQEELQEDFVERRVRLQREILAQRLGLRGVVQAVGGTVLSDVITEEDLLMIDDTTKHETNRINDSKRQRISQKKEDSGSIRALLVMEMQQQQEHDGSGAATSHKNPQTLLATELIFRMFDPSWHVRHGACLGILSLLRAWKGIVGHGAFGMWPLDIMARCLCVLSLDRFGDYSGATVGKDNDGGESVVAPVREVAGQVLSILWSMAPAPIQKSCLHVLICFSTRVEWEVRHGALLAFKYIVVLLSSSILKTMPVESTIVPMNEISQVARTCLADNVEDVQSIAAQILLRILETVQGDPSQQKQLIHSSSLQLWDSLDQLRDVSSCAVDFVRFFSVMICQDSSLVCSVLASNRGKAPVVMSSIVAKLLRFLNFDSTAVNISALKAIGRLPVAFLSRLEDLKEQEVSESLTRSYCSLLERVFLSFTVGRYAVSPHENDKESRTRYDNLCAALDASWQSLVNSAGPVLQRSPALLNNLVLRLVMLYAKIDHDSGGGDASILSPISAGALSRLVVKVKDSVGIAGTRLDQFLELIFSLLLKSPWKEHCERACILYHSLMSNGYPLLPQSHELLQLLQQSTPPCLSPNLENVSRNILSNPEVIEGVNRALRSVLAFVLVDRGATGDVEADIFWHVTLESTGFTYPTLESDGDLAPISTSSMQVYSMIAGAIVSGGYEHLPQKLTPLVRALMTSIKSERTNERQFLTCQSLALLLQVLSRSKDEARLRVRNKVVENLCIMLSSDHHVSENLGERSDMASQPASEIIALLVSQLPNDETLECIPPIWDRLRLVTEASEGGSLEENLRLLLIVAKALKPETNATRHVIAILIEPLVPIASSHRTNTTRIIATSIIVTLCHPSPELAMDTSLPLILSYLQDMSNDSRRLGSLRLLQSIVEAMNTKICPFVRCLLPVTMAMMTDPLDECAKQAAHSFATLVRISPLVKVTERRQWEKQNKESQTEKVIDHLIHGKPLPPCTLPKSIMKELNEADVSLRDYQMEGIAWLRFLQEVRLNGILADDMGLGKTLQALSAVALTHEEAARADASSKPVSLVVCPSTLVGHWLAEIRKFFPRQSVLKGLSNICKRNKGAVVDVDCNIVVISYSILRREAAALSNIKWHYCILDEGHLLKNPKTATAISARRLQSEHKLILTGTPVQNRVHELWAAFDFLMPNFLGSQSWFSKNFARPISNGQLQGSSAESISEGMEKLKLLHQQVLPFILRREKDQVMKELPPKCITDIPCSMTSEQQDLYESFCQGADARKAVAAIQDSIDDASGDGSKESKLGGEALKSLLYLRLLCTHPSLVQSRILNARASCSDPGYTRFDSSGKLKVLNDLLRSAGICGEELTAADNDSSALYTEFDENDMSVDDASALFISDGDVGDMITSSTGAEVKKGSKCLIFAQFTQSLDIVERLLFQTQMPSLRYLRLDGSVPPDKRTGIVETFNQDESIKVLLLTSRVGSLGLNLTGASTVIFLEHDYNPHADLQAMDRAHRIGQSKTVNVYRLITQNSIEEKIMNLQETKMTMSKAIVNSENSTMYSMGTDRLLDIFTFRSDSEDKSKKSSKTTAMSLDALEDEYNGEDYASLSLKRFIDGFRDVAPREGGSDNS